VQRESQIADLPAKAVVVVRKKMSENKRGDRVQWNGPIFSGGERVGSRTGKPEKILDESWKRSGGGD